MRFLFPDQDLQQQAADFIQEFQEHSSPVHGSGGLDRFLREKNYAEWVIKVRRDMDVANVPAGQVPSLTYFYVREEDGRIVGMINIRLALNDFLRRLGGHIGYSVRPTERGKGYGTSMLREAMAFLAPIGLHRVIITCDKENLASARVIQNCGGRLEAEFYSEEFNETVQRYVIEQGQAQEKRKA